MKKPSFPITILAFGTTLAGCATSPVLEQRMGQALPGDVTASYDSGADTVTVSKNGAGSLTLVNSGSVGSTPGYSNTTTFALRQTTGSGKGAVVTIASPDAELGIVGVIVTRAEAVEVPSSGTANYSGEYSGFLVDASNKTAVGGISGMTCLTANFGAGNISGAIAGRSLSLADVIIPSMPISGGGTFSGAITGGKGPGAGDTASNGQLLGMFADVGGGEIVGALRLDHNYSGTDYYEVGGFTTSAGACP